jgi:superfamily II DNA/RNA helicase
VDTLLQVLLFSATLHSPEVRALAAAICQNPIFVDLKGKNAVPETGGPRLLQHLSAFGWWECGML